MLSALIGAGTSILGGILGNKSADKAAKRAEQQRHREYLQQKEFAQSGIQWKAKDAKKAGIHPLYALGANTVSYSPQSIGDTGGSDFSFLANAGQNIGRAIDATRSTPAKATALATTAAEIQLEGLRLDNDLKRTQLASAMSTVYQTGLPPGLPSSTQRPAVNGLPGQGNTPQIEGPGIKLEKTISPANASAGNQEYAEIPEVQFTRTPTGWAPAMPQQLSEAYENDWVGGWQWQARNKYLPAMMANDGRNPYFRPPGHIRLGHGQKWVFDVMTGEWQIKSGRADHWVR